MTGKRARTRRILALAPTSIGLGYAVFDDTGILADWGIKHMQRASNEICRVAAEKLLHDYAPSIVVVQNPTSKIARRSDRIKLLITIFMAMVTLQGRTLKAFTHEEVRTVFFGKRTGTKHELALLLVQKFPEQLTRYLPPKRKLWKAESPHMGIFDAVALALAAQLKPRKPSHRPGPLESRPAQSGDEDTE